MKSVPAMRTLVLALALAMLAPVSVSDVADSGEMGQSNDVMFVRLDIPGADSQKLAPYGVDIVETYDGFVIAKINRAQAVSLEGNGIGVEYLADMFELDLKAATFDVRGGEPAIPASLHIDSYPAGVSGYYLVQFIGPVKDQWRRQLAALGAEVLGYVPNDAFIVRMNPEARRSVENLRQVTWTGIYQPAYKIDPSLSGVSGIVPVEIITFSGERVGPVVAFLNKHGYGKTDSLGSAPGVVSFYQGSESGKVRARIDASLIAEIARLDSVEFIEPYGRPIVQNFYSQAVHQTNLTPTLIPGARKIWEMGIRGQGQIVSIADTGLDFDHNMFRESESIIALGDIYNVTDYSRRKVIRYLPMANYTGVDPMDDEWAWKDSSFMVLSCTVGHGTGTAGILAGNDDTTAIVNETDFDGMAKEAKIFFQDIGTVRPSLYSSECYEDILAYIPDDMNLLYGPAYEAGARIHSNSWHQFWPATQHGFYTMTSREIDEFMWKHPDSLVVFAEGNDYTEIQDEPAAKNVMAVGAAHLYPSHNNMAPWSTMGPTVDGRQKPTVVFTGEGFTSLSDGSPWSDGNRSLLISFAGTSYSTQNAAGHAALVRQYFTDGWYPTGGPVAGDSFNPQASLIMAMIAASGEKMTGFRAHPLNEDRFPNDAQGWGRPLLDNVLYFAGEDRIVRVVDDESGFTTGQWEEYEVGVVNSSQELKIIMSWTDYPGTIGAARILVNDLDLLVTAPNGDTYKGNVWDIFDKGESMSNTGGHDFLNNTEGVIVKSPMTGIWKIKVTAANVPSGPQPYSIVGVGGLDPNMGQVFLDRHSYSEDDIVGITVVDTNAVGPVIVTVSSTTEPWGENVTLAETAPGSGVFRASIETAFGTPLPNGIVEVSEGDLLEAVYEDADPPHQSRAHALIETMRPAIFDVRVTSITNSGATVTWRTDMPADSRIYYGTSPPLTFQKSAPELSESHSINLVDLQTETVYYFDVESSDARGHRTLDDNGGVHYRFKTSMMGDILLVFGDETFASKSGMGVEAYKQSLASRGWTFSEWHVQFSGDPSLALMQSHLAVIWQVGIEQYPPHSDYELSLIQDYLDEGGRLFYVHHDTYWAYCSPNSSWVDDAKCSWVRAVLKASLNESNWYGGDPWEIQGIIGEAGDPISGPYSSSRLVYYTYRTGGAADEVIPIAAGGATSAVWRDWIAPAPSGNISVKWISDSENGTLGTGVWGGYRSRMVGFYANWIGIENNYNYPFNENRTDILDRTLIWLLGRDHPDVHILSPNGGETITSDSVTITWDRTAYGANVGTQSAFYSPDGGQSWTVIAQGIPGANTSHPWYIDSTVCNSHDYLVRIKVEDDGVPSFSSSDDSDSVFTVMRANGDCGGPLVWPGSVRVRPNPVMGPVTVYVNATVDDRLRGYSDIDASRPAEFFFDVAGADGTGYGMNLTSPPTSPTENVTWSGFLDSLPRRCYAVYLHGQDATGKWGPFQNGTFCVQDEPPPPVPPAPPGNVDAHLVNNAEDVRITWDLSPDDSLTVDNYEIWCGQSGYDRDKGQGYALLGTAPPGHGEFVHAGVGLDHTTYFYFVKAVNLFGGSSSANQAVKFARELPAGRHLISIPVDADDNALSSILQTVDYESARWFDSSDADDPWESNVIARPYNDFVEADRGVGLWIEVASDSIFSVAGRVPETTTIFLHEGWNLIGFPSFAASYTVADLKAAVPNVIDVEAYDGDAAPYYLQKVDDTFGIAAGCGYWILVSSDSVWLLTN